MNHDDDQPTKRHTRNRNLRDTRRELLDAGMRLLLQEGVDLGMKKLSAVAVAAEAGRTTGALYQLWPNQGQYHRDLAIELVRRREWSHTQRLRDLATDLALSGASLEELIGSAADAYLQHLVESRVFYLTVHFWGAALNDDELRTAIRGGYDDFHGDFVAFYEALLAFYKLTLRPPYTIDDLAIAFSAATEGFLLRAGVDPERLRSSESGRLGSYAATLYAIAQAMTEPIEDGPPT